jgi:putative hydrolase of the HAD superfamily
MNLDYNNSASKTFSTFFPERAIMIKAVFVDMDDTLIVNAVLYDHARMQLCGYLRNYGLKNDEIIAHNVKINADLFPTHGYSRERFPLSFEMTLKHFIPNADDDMIAEVRAMAETTFNTVAPLKPGTLEAVDLLTARFPVYMVTQGDKGVQENRIAHLPFKDKLAGIFIVDKKSKETFEALGQKLGLQPGEAVMAGDSIKSDVATAVAAGFYGVWIEAHNWTAVEKAEFPRERAFKFSSLLEFARHLDDAGALHAPTQKFTPQPKPPGLN